MSADLAIREPHPLDADEARRLTDELKADAEALWAKVVALFERGAHTALGYSSWGTYLETEFGKHRRTAYRLLDAGRVVSALSDQLVTGALPANEAQARELAPLLDAPEQLREAWAEVVDLHPKPTAAVVREVVRRKLPGPKTAQKQAAETGIAVPSSDGRIYLPHGEAPHPYWLTVVHWARDLDEMPDPGDLTVPSYGGKFEPAAIRVHAYLTAVLASRKETAS